jgi:hypothetical protein
MKSKIVNNLNEFNDWFAEYLVLNEMHGVLEPSPLRYPATVHWEQEEPCTEYSYYKLYYHFTYDR